MILQDVNRFTDCFDYVSFKHIYRERNSATYAMAKAGGRIMEGSSVIKEQQGDDIMETFQVFQWSYGT